MSHLRVGIRDVAKSAGVSPGTVSNVLNHPERVSEAKRQRVMDAVEKLKFVRNESARQLRTGSSRTLGLVLLDAWNPFFTELASGVEDWTFERGWKVLIANTARQPERESSYLDLYTERRVEGIIIVPNGDLSGRLSDLRRAGIGTMVVDQHDRGPGSLSVSVDDVRGGELAMAHLLDSGHRRVAFIGSAARVVQVRDRLKGAKRAIGASRARIQCTIIEPDALTLGAGYEVGERLIALPPGGRPTGVFACSDLVAIGILHVLIQHGVRVPEDIALIGYDDIEFARQVAVPLTTIRQPSYEMGRRAAAMLTAQLEGTPPRKRHVVFQPELIVRASCSLRRGRRSAERAAALQSIIETSAAHVS